MPRRPAEPGPTARDTLLAELVGLGLVRNEGLAWLALLEDDTGRGLTGYEVAARSNVPRSAVYAVLRGLEAAGAAFSHGQEPQRFVAIAPEQWLDRKRRDQLARVEAVGRLFAALPKRDRPEPVFILARYDDVLARADLMIRAAEKSVYLSMWPRELDRLARAVGAVADRPLHRVLHSPAPLPPPPGFATWPDPGDSARAGWSHKLLVVVDRREALIGGAEPAADNHAVWTTNPSLVDVATNHIVLDITRIAQATGQDCAADVAPMMRTRLDG